MEKEEIKYQIIKDCFKQLSPACQQLINCHFRGLNNKAIAQKLEIPADKVDQQMYACRESLRKCYKKNNI